MEFAVVFALGVLFGLIIASFLNRSNSVGDLRIDTSDPDGPYLFLELSKGVGDIYRKKYVTLRINTKNYLSQK